MYPRVKTRGPYPWELDGKDDGLLSENSETNISHIYFVAVTALGRDPVNAHERTVCHEALCDKSTAFILAGFLGRTLYLKKSPR